MIYYQLPNGKTVKLTIEESLNINDDLINELMYRGYGEDFSDPWVDSPIQRGSRDVPDDLEYPEDPEE